MDTSNTNSKDFYILSVEIFKMLSLQREHRNVSALSFLDEKYQEYIKYVSTSNVLTIKIKDNLEEIPITLDTKVYNDNEVIEIITSRIDDRTENQEIPTRPVNNI
jgi:hypothetical protein